jgi:hypothetical protein
MLSVSITIYAHLLDFPQPDQPQDALLEYKGGTNCGKAKRRQGFRADFAPTRPSMANPANLLDEKGR